MDVFKDFARTNGSVTPDECSDTNSLPRMGSQSTNYMNSDGNNYYDSDHAQLLPRSHTTESTRATDRSDLNSTEMDTEIRPILNSTINAISNKPAINSSSDEINQRSGISRFGRYLLGLELDLDIPSDSVLEDAWSVATKRRGVYNLIQVPTRLERLLALGQFICIDEFLSTFTYLPIRAGLAILHILKRFLLSPISLFQKKPLETSEKDLERKTKVRVSHTIDLLHISLLIFTAIALQALDMSWIYHNIRGQSFIKLYVVFNVIEIFDRLCSSFGVDILDSLGWTTASAATFFTRLSQRPTSTSTSATHARALQGVALLTRMIIDYLFSLVYLVIHASLLLTWVVTLNVAINTQNNALLTLLVSNNFVELKGSVFKNFKVQNLFQITCSDAVERFQLTVFLCIMMVVTRGDSRLFSTWGVIYGCEIIVDWIKHAFVTKFNRIPHRIYHRFSLVICDDVAKTQTHNVVRSIGGSSLSKRIGFVSLPLASLVIRMVYSYVKELPVLIIFLLWSAILCFKTALNIGLMGHAWRKVHRGVNEADGDEVEKDEYWMQKLVQVERYEIVSKN